VIRRLTPCFLSVLLLAACGKRQDSSTTDPAGGETAPKPAATSGRAKRERPAAETDSPRAALKAASELESPEEREKAVAEVAWNALELDPVLAREAFALLSPDSTEKIRLIQHSAMRLAESDLDGALKWADTLGTEKETAAAKCQIALVLAESEPLRAANILSESGIEGREFDVTAVQVLQRWAAKSPPDAAAWVVAFPPGAARSAGIKEVVSRWLQADAPAVFSWKGKLADASVGKDVDSALMEISAEQPGQASWLQHADPVTRSAIEAKRKEAGHDNPPP